MITSSGLKANDQHPPHSFDEGQILIAQVYKTLFGDINPRLKNDTVLLLVWDEHGGFYDHVPPPWVQGKDWPKDQGKHFVFCRLGVRIPAILVSPWLQQEFVSTQFDHSSIPKTICDNFGIHTTKFERRVQIANDFLKGRKWKQDPTILSFDAQIIELTKKCSTEIAVIDTSGSWVETAGRIFNGMWQKISESISSSEIMKEFLALRDHFFGKPPTNFGTIRLEPGPEAFQPRKDIIIKVLRGRNLTNKDHAPGSGTSDPYVKLTCGSGLQGTNWKTQKKIDTLDPVWNEAFVFPAVSWVENFIVIECWDANVLEDDEFMGEIILNGNSLKTGTVTHWETLKANPAKGGSVTGEIELRVTKRPE